MHHPMPRDQRARNLAEIYMADPAERRPLATLALIAGGSVRTLERLFKAETALSPKDWVLQWRMICALEMLAENEPVGEVAFTVGFEKPSSSIAKFRRHFGATPGQYFIS